MQAIADYEASNSIPPGWINHSISASGPSGSWSRLERGEIPLDAAFFASFSSDLTDETIWRAFHTSRRREPQQPQGEAAPRAPPPPPPPPPAIDAEALFWEMMTVARRPDPSMWPALQRLRAHADRRGDFVLAALSNTCVFPPGHAFNSPHTAEGRFQAELRAKFDVFVSSAHVGMRKPERRIYEHALGVLGAVARAKGWAGVEAADVLFLDDIGGNLRGGREAGMRTIKVALGRADLAVEELERVMGLDLTTGKAAKL